MSVETAMQGDAVVLGGGDAVVLRGGVEVWIGGAVLPGKVRTGIGG